MAHEEQLESIFGDALDLAAEKRGAFLDEACRDRPELRLLVEELLLEEQRAGSFLAVPVAFAGTGARESAASEAFQTTALTVKNSRFQPSEVIASRFEVVGFLARGGMGEVYEVKDRLLHGARVALKIILPEIAARADTSYRFEQEVLLARRVVHPNLCPIYELFRCEEPAPAFLFLTMKLLRGETLAACLRRPEPLSFSERVDVCGKLLAGVAAIHAAGVIHRDLKPNNVMLERSGETLCASIMDFGLARLHESETTVLKTGAVAGTPGYLAPELMQGQRPTQSTDLFALGVVLHEVLTGKHPAEPMSSKESLDAVPCSAELKRAIRAFLSNDPENRCRAFAKLLAETNSEVRLSSSRRGTAPLLTRRRFALAGGAAAAVFASSAALQHQQIYNLLHPLPAKRFVAVLNWPPSSDTRMQPMLLGLVDAIADELAKAEAFDHNFFVAAEKTLAPLTTPAELNEVREALGANLVLATSAATIGELVRVSLRVLDPVSGRTLRSGELHTSSGERAGLPERTVQAAAALLDVQAMELSGRHRQGGTESPQALAAFQKAELLRRQENDAGLTQAIEMYKRALEEDPHYALAQARLGWAYLRSYGKTNDAAALTLGRANCEAAVALDSELVDARVGVAAAMNLTGDHHAAFQEIAKALSVDPANAHTLIDQAQIYVDDGQYAKAENSLKRALKLRPNYWLPHSEYGVLLANQGRFPQALLEFRSAALLAPLNALNQSNLGSVHLQLGHLDEAAQACQKSLHLDPNDGAALTLAEVARIRAKYPEAIAFAQQATQLAPAYSVNWIELGDCFTAAGRSPEATNAYRQAEQVEDAALSTEPKSGPGWMRLAFCRAKLGNKESVRPLLEKASTFHADDLSSRLMRIRTLALIGEVQEALNEMQACLRQGATAFQFQTMPDLQALKRDACFLNSLATPSSPAPGGGGEVT